MSNVVILSAHKLNILAAAKIAMGNDMALDLHGLRVQAYSFASINDIVWG